MQEITGTDASAQSEPPGSTAVSRKAQVVSTHVLVPEAQADQLRELSKRTRIAQSEYLREAVDDLLGKYGRRPEEGP